MRLEHNYKTSKDYEKLYELIQLSRIVCFVDSEMGKYKVKDICISGVLFGEDTGANIGARGIGYINAFSNGIISLKEDFIEQCEDYNLEYIEPDGKI